MVRRQPRSSGLGLSQDGDVQEVNRGPSTSLLLQQSEAALPLRMTLSPGLSRLSLDCGEA